jgi:hypothetical protein
LRPRNVPSASVATAQPEYRETCISKVGDGYVYKTYASDNVIG